MRVYDDLMSSPLLILSAEQYIGAADLHSSKKAEKVKESPAARSEEGPRKRAKTSSKISVSEVGEGGAGEEEDEEDPGADEKSKRARGRPRLDTRDQNAADRRRTQIRLAQRAYRSRKENAIQTLENEVRALQETKAEMSNAFMRLHDFAVSQGILEKAPAFARELQSTTEQILTLAKKPYESGGENSRTSRTVKDSESPKKGLEHQPEAPSPSKAVEAPPTNLSGSVWGYTFDNDTRMDPSLDMSDVSHVSHAPAAQTAITQAPLGYEIITMPTLDNASFPFDPNARDPLFPQGAIRSTQDQNVTPNITPNITAPVFPPPASLPMPTTGAYVETTFGRHLQRRTIEFACRLSTMPNLPNDNFVKVFGFCLLFEPIEQIRARLHKSLERTRQESLNNWRAPFWALGGIGQHQIGVEQQDRFVGNQGTVDVAKHALGTNFAMGPFDAATTEARDRQLDADMRIMLPGYQGEYLDPDEVELYLQSRGVCIQPGQDYVTAEVDMAWLEDMQQQQSNDSYRQWMTGMPPPTGKTSDTTAAMAAVDGTWMGGEVLSDTRAATNFLGLTNDVKSVLANQKRIVTLNVDVFVRELIRTAVCLGRTPAFRQEDVNKAFWLATRGNSDLNF